MVDEAADATTEAEDGNEDGPSAAGADEECGDEQLKKALNEWLKNGFGFAQHKDREDLQSLKPQIQKLMALFGDKDQEKDSATSSSHSFKQFNDATRTPRKVTQKHWFVCFVT